MGTKEVELLLVIPGGDWLGFEFNSSELGSC